jgi:hypothetical protein
VKQSEPRLGHVPHQMQRPGFFTGTGGLFDLGQVEYPTVNIAQYCVDHPFGPTLFGVYVSSANRTHIMARLLAVSSPASLSGRS